MIDILRWILRWAPELKANMLWAALFKVLESMFMGLPYLFLYLTLDRLLAGNLGQDKVLFYTLGVLLCLVLQGTFAILFNLYIWPSANAMVRKLRLMVGEHLRLLSMGYFSHQNTGSIHTLVTNEMLGVQSAIYQSYPDFIVALGAIVIAPLVLLTVDWRLALALVATLPAAYPIYHWCERELGKGLHERSDLLEEVNSEILDYVQGIEVIKAFKQTDQQYERFAASMERFRDENIRQTLKAVVPINMLKIFIDGGLVVTLLVAVFLLLAGRVELSVALIFLILCLRIYDPMKRVIPGLAFVKLAEPGLKKIDRLLKIPPLPQVLPEAEPDGYEISFERVSFTYEKDREPAAPDLKQVSFTVPENTMTALVGPSGSGKTTITRLLARFWDVDQGRVTLGGKDIRQMPVDRLLSRISMVFQDVYLFNDTIFQNIAYGAVEATREQVIAASRVAQCHEFIRDLPDGYGTIVGEGGATLSGGEKQRISIARAILKDAPIILLDEATASVDPGNEELIQRALQALIGSKTLLVIAHRLSTIVTADQIVVLNQRGEVEEVGSHHSLLEKQGLYFRLWQERQKSRQWRIAASGDRLG